MQCRLFLTTTLKRRRPCYDVATVTHIVPLMTASARASFAWSFAALMATQLPLCWHCVLISFRGCMCISHSFYVHLSNPIHCVPLIYLHKIITSLCVLECMSCQSTVVCASLSACVCQHVLLLLSITPMFRTSEDNSADHHLSCSRVDLTIKPGRALAETT